MDAASMFGIDGSSVMYIIDVFPFCLLAQSMHATAKSNVDVAMSILL